MYRIIVFFLASFACVNLSFSQSQPIKTSGKLKGIIRDQNEGTPLEYATITVYAKDSTFAGGGVSIKDGTFAIELKKGEYYAIVQFISYEKKTINNIRINEKNPVFNAGTISLMPQSSALSEVTVTAEKSQMLVALDHKVFNVGKDLSSTGKSALEILDNIPSISVDVDGNISMRGSQDIQILVDGKPSGLYNASNPDALKNLPGDMIDHIEVITNPSSKYQAEGMVGIINIVLKKDQQKGVNGSLNLSAGYPQAYSGGLNVNFRRKKINFYFNYGAGYSERPGNGKSFQEFFDTTNNNITSISRVDNNRLRTQWSQNFRGGADLYINPKNTLTGEFVFGLNKENNSTSVGYNDYSALDSLQSISIRNDEEKSMEREIEFSLNYEKKFEQKDRKLTVNIQFFNHNESNSSDIHEDSIPVEQQALHYIKLKQRDTTDQTQQNLVIQADYVHPFATNGKIETGYRSQFRKITNPYVLDNLDTSGRWINQPGYTNHFVYNENIYAGYLQASDKFGIFTVQAGLRVEASDVRTHLLETNTGNNRVYVDYFPSVHLTCQLDPANSVQLSYSRRINRPSIWMLNPFHSYTDARNFRAGNPALKPEYTDAFEGGYLLTMEKINFYSGLYYRLTHGVIDRYTQVLNVDTTLQIPINLSKRESYGAEVNATLDLVKWWTLSGNVNLYRSITSGSYNSEKLSSDNFAWDGRISTRMRFPGDLDFQVMYTYRGRQQTTQGLLKPFYMMNAGISKDLLKHNATLTFNVNDVLNSRRFRYVIDQPDLYSENEFRWSKRSYSLTFTYRLNQKKKVPKGSENGENNGGGENMDY